MHAEHDAPAQAEQLSFISDGNPCCRLQVRFPKHHHAAKHVPSTKCSAPDVPVKVVHKLLA